MTAEEAEQVGRETAARRLCDVIVVGAGNAGLCAALSAREHGAEVLVLERAPIEERGGNSRFTAGAFRCVYDGVGDLRRLMPDLTEEEIAGTDFGVYPAAQFYEDMGRVTQYRTDPDLCELLVGNSFDTILWLRRKGVRFQPMYGRQAFQFDGRFRFWGGLTIEAWGGGPGLIAALCDRCAREAVPILYEARALSLLRGEDGGVRGVRARISGAMMDLKSRAVVLASGGFEANSEWRTRYLGPVWELARVRGTRFNTGDGLRMALEADAMPWGHWSGCHAVAWDLNAPPFGDLTVGDGFQKHSYPLGIMLNAAGERFVDEGADFRNYTYAKYGRTILQQPNQLAWQIFDRKVLHLLRDEYRIRQVSKVRADTLEDLLARLEGVNSAAALQTIRSFNAAIDQGKPFNPNIKDGRCTRGLKIDKSNWANTIEDPPFEAYGVTCGITFTFGGVRIDPNACVLDTEERIIPGLFAAGELVGGLFYFNYPGGTGLMSGAVFGRIAGASAALTVKATAKANESLFRNRAVKAKTT
jgi:tricarballylate dehydrogenase